MYINCELKGHATDGKHCIGCRYKGCHLTDANTRLTIGRPNYGPHFRCSKFESGDIAIYERYLGDDYVISVCGDRSTKGIVYTERFSPLIKIV